MVKTGQADGMIMVANAERLSDALASQEVLSRNETLIFVRPSPPQFEALQAVRQPAELARFKVTSYLGNGWLRGRMPEDVKWLRTLDDVLRLAAREPDLVLVGGRVADAAGAAPAATGAGLRRGRLAAGPDEHPPADRQALAACGAIGGV